MYARLVTIQLSPDKIDEAIRLYRDSVMPAAKQEKGFKGGRLLVDRKTGKGISVVIWETEADAQGTGQASAYFQEQIAKFASFFTASPVVELYEIPVFVA